MNVQLARRDQGVPVPPMVFVIAPRRRVAVGVFLHAHLLSEGPARHRADVAGTSDVKATDQPSDALNNARLMLPFLPPVLLHSHAFGPTAQKDAVSV